jgi:hypothetical protein
LSADISAFINIIRIKPVLWVAKKSNYKAGDLLSDSLSASKSFVD